MKNTKSLIFTLGILFLVGCATMFDGPTQKIMIDSNPAGAKVFVAVKDKKGLILKKQEVGITPLEVVLSRKDGVVILELEGYESTEAPLVRGTNGTVVLDFLALSLLSTSIDLSTGAWHEYDPGKYLVELKPLAEE